MTGPERREFLSSYDEELVFADGLEDALIGIAETGQGLAAVYDERKVLAIMQERDGMTEEDAQEFYSYNVLRALPYYKRAPVFITLHPWKELEEG